MISESLLLRLHSLLSLPAEEQVLTLDAEVDLHTMPVWSLLHAHARRACAGLAAAGGEDEGDEGDEGCMEEEVSAAEVATLALALAERLSPELHGPRLVADARALSASVLASVRRLEGRLPAAERLLAKAERSALAGSADPYILAEIFLERAWVIRGRGQPVRACTFFDAAADLFARCQNPAMQGAALIQKAVVLAALRREEEAEDLLDRARALLREAGARPAGDAGDPGQPG